MIAFVVFILGASTGFVIGAAWGSMVMHRRAARFMYRHPDIGEAVRRAAKRSS